MDFEATFLLKKKKKKKNPPKIKRKWPYRKKFKQVVKTILKYPANEGIGRVF